MEELWQCV